MGQAPLGSGIDVKLYNMEAYESSNVVLTQLLVIAPYIAFPTLNNADFVSMLLFKIIVLFIESLDEVLRRIVGIEWCYSNIEIQVSESNNDHIKDTSVFLPQLIKQ